MSKYIVDGWHIEINKLKSYYTVKAIRYIKETPIRDLTVEVRKLLKDKGIELYMEGLLELNDGYGRKYLDFAGRGKDI